MRIDNKITSQLIKSRRKYLGMTQNELSKSLPVKLKSDQFVSNIERRKAQLPPSHIYKLSKALEINPLELVEAMTEDYKRSLLTTVWKQQFEEL